MNPRVETVCCGEMSLSEDICVWYEMGASEEMLTYGNACFAFNCYSYRDCVKLVSLQRNLFLPTVITFVS